MKKFLNSEINKKYYSDLNKHIELNFRSRCLKYFSDKTKNPVNAISFSNNQKINKNKSKEIYTGGYLNSSPEDTKKEYDLKSIFDEKNIVTEPKDIPEKKIDDKIYRRNKSHKLLKIFIDHAIESPFKYNPNYSSIYKNIPNIKLNPKQYAISLRKKVKYNIELNKMKLFKKEKEKEREKEHKNIEMKQCKIFGKIIKRDFKNKNINKKYNIKKNINKHALSFNKNDSRNQINKLNIKNKNNSRILTYINNYNYIANNKHKNVNFKKMLSRNDFMYKYFHEYFGLTYIPKYTMVDKNIPSIIFDSKEKIKHFQKQIKLRKVLSSYKIIKNYETIDENKLSNNISIKIKN